MDQYHRSEILFTDHQGKISKNCLCLTYTDFNVLSKYKATFLHPQEIEFFKAIKYVKRQKSYLQGRYCAKLAIIRLFPALQANELYINNSILGFPYIVAPTINIQVSISHSGNDAVAIAYKESNPMAVDIEQIVTTRKLAMQSQLNQQEINLINKKFNNLDYGLMVAWTAKEALSKILKCGMNTNFNIFEINDISLVDTKHIVTFTNFSQYHAIAWQARSAVCTLVMPLE